jgi:Uma2 family endonuclease
MLDPSEFAPETMRPLSRAEYERLVAIGMFEDERVELLYGAVVEMSPKGPAHESALERLLELFVRALVPRATVRVQSAFAASDSSEPEPDLVIVPRRSYETAHPSEAFLVVEVSQSSLGKDRGVKARVYAESGVPEYWVVNVVDGVIERHTAPRDGRYETVATHRRGERIALVCFPDVVVAVADVLAKR